jgi:hypothetical protein
VPACLREGGEEFKGRGSAEWQTEGISRAGKEGEQLFDVAKWSSKRSGGRARRRWSQRFVSRSRRGALRQQSPAQVITSPIGAGCPQETIVRDLLVSRRVMLRPSYPELLAGHEDVQEAGVVREQAETARSAPLCKGPPNMPSVIGSEASPAVTGPKVRKTPAGFDSDYASERCGPVCIPESTRTAALRAAQPDSPSRNTTNCRST